MKTRKIGCFRQGLANNGKESGRHRRIKVIDLDKVK